MYLGWTLHHKQGIEVKVCLAQFKNLPLVLIEISNYLAKKFP